MGLVFALTFYFVLFGLAAYPIWYRCFRTWGPSSLVFSSVLGWGLVTAISWWLAVVQIPISFYSAIIALGLLSAACWVGYKKLYQKYPELPTLKQSLPLLFWFILISGIYIYLRGFRPEINNLEKFPDMAMIFSIFRGGVVPPLDPFTAGETINYYYLGHFQSALFSKLLFVQPNVFFHYHVASLFALTSMGLYAAAVGALNQIFPVKEKSLNYICGGVAALLGVIAGNFQAFYETIIMRKPKFWYPDSTRYIDKTIHEYPSYSFIVGDLHGHLMNMPFAIFCFALVVAWSKRLESFDVNTWMSDLKKQSPFIALMGFVTASSYLINAWDILTLLMLIGFVSWFSIAMQSRFFHLNVLKFLTCMSLLLILLSVLYYLPYWWLFHPPASGLQLVPPDKSSPVVQLLIIWVVHLFFPATYLLFHSKFKDTSPLLRSVALLSILFVIFIEFAFFRDIYPDHFRANTMFKIGIQVWFWGSICTGVVFALILSLRVHWWKWTRYMHMAIAGILLGAGIYYTLRAVPQSFGFDRQHSLDGMSFMREADPDSYELISWIRSNVSGQPILLEAVGDSFSQQGRISVFTGLPNVLQWPIHVWLWRGSYDQSLIPKSRLEIQSGSTDSVVRRENDVKVIYETKDLSKAKDLLLKYGVRYVVIGKPELLKYKNLQKDKFRSLGKVVFKYSSIEMYEIH